MKKYLHSFLRYFVFFLLGFAVFYLMSAAVTVVYNLLKVWLPEAFPDYNAVTEKEAMLAIEANLSLISGILTLPVLTVFTVKYDNERYEELISKTNGFYTMREGARIYISSYLGADILSALSVPIPFAIFALFRFPESQTDGAERLSNLLETFLSLISAFTDKLGFAVGLILILFISLISRLPAGYMGLKRWRGLWLSDTGN